MESGLSLQTRRELLQQGIPQYRQTTTVKKKCLNRHAQVPLKEACEHAPLIT
jgi:hypothetical protein